MNVIISAKQNNVPMYSLSTSSVNTLKSIAENRTLGAYAAQGLLMAYYDKDYLIPIETNQGVGYRTKSDPQSTNLELSILDFNPSQVDDNLIVTIRLVAPESEADFIIYSAEGKQLYHRNINSANTLLNINTSEWPAGLFFGIVSSKSGVIANNRGIKK